MFSEKRKREFFTLILLTVMGISFAYSQDAVMNLITKNMLNDKGQLGEYPDPADYSGSSQLLRDLEFSNFQVNDSYMFENNTIYLYQNDTIVIEVQAGPEAEWVNIGLKHKTFPVGNEFNYTMTRDNYQSFQGEPSGTSYMYNWTLRMDGTDQTGIYQGNFTAWKSGGTEYSVFYFNLKLLNPVPVINNLTVLDGLHSSHIPIQEGGSYQTYRDQSLQFQAYMYDIPGTQIFPLLALNYSKTRAQEDAGETPNMIFLTYQDYSTDDRGRNVSKYTGTLPVTFSLVDPDAWVPWDYTFDLWTNSSYNDQDGQGVQYLYYHFLFKLEIINLPPEISTFWADKDVIDPATWSASPSHDVSLYINGTDSEDDRLYYPSSQQRVREYLRSPVSVPIEEMERLTHFSENLTSNIADVDGKLVEVNSTPGKDSYIEFPIDLKDVNALKIDSQGRQFNISMKIMVNQPNPAGQGIRLQVKRAGSSIWDTWGTNVTSNPGVWQWVSFLDSTLPSNLALYSNQSSYLLKVRFKVWDAVEDVYIALDNVNFTYSTETRESFAAIGLQLWRPTSDSPDLYVINEWWDDTLKLWKFTLTFPGSSVPGAYTFRLILMDHGALPYVDVANTETNLYSTYFYQYKSQRLAVAETTRTIILNQNKEDAINASDHANHFHPKPLLNSTSGTIDKGDNLEVTLVVQDEKLATMTTNDWNETALALTNTFMKSTDEGSNTWRAPLAGEIEDGYRSNITAADGDMFDFQLSASSTNHYRNSSFRMDFQFSVPFWVDHSNISFLEMGIGGYITEDGGNVYDYGTDGVTYMFWNWTEGEWRWLPAGVLNDYYEYKFSELLYEDQIRVDTLKSHVNAWNVSQILSEDFRVRLRVDFVDTAVVSGTSAGKLRVGIDYWNVSLGFENQLGGALYVHKNFDPLESYEANKESVKIQLVRNTTDAVNYISYWKAFIPTALYNAGNYTFHAYLQNSNSSTWFFGARYANSEMPYYSLEDELVNLTMYRNQTFQIFPYGLSVSIQSLSNQRLFRRGIDNALKTEGTIQTGGFYSIGNFRLEFKRLDGVETEIIQVKASAGATDYDWLIPATAETTAPWNANLTLLIIPFDSGRYIYRAVFTNNDTSDNIAWTRWQEIYILNDPPKISVTSQPGGEIYRVVGRKDLELYVYDTDTNPNSHGTQPRLEIRVQNRDLAPGPDQLEDSPYEMLVAWEASSNQQTLLGGGTYLYSSDNTADLTYVSFPRWVLARDYQECQFVLNDTDTYQPQVSLLRTNRTTYDVRNNLPAFQSFTITLLGQDYYATQPIDVLRHNNLRVQANMTDIDDPWHETLNVTAVTTYTPDGSKEYRYNTSINYDGTNHEFYFDKFIFRTDKIGAYTLVLTFKDPEGGEADTPTFDINVLNNLPEVKLTYYSKDGVANITAPGIDTYSPGDFKIYRGNETLYLEAWVYDVEDSWINDLKCSAVRLDLYHKTEAAQEDDPWTYDLAWVQQDGITKWGKWITKVILPINVDFNAGNLTARFVAVDDDSDEGYGDRNLKVMNDPPKFIGDKYKLWSNLTMDLNGNLNISVWAQDYEGIRSIAVKFRLEMPSVNDIITVRITSDRWKYNATTKEYWFNITLIGDLATVDNYEYINNIYLVLVEARDYDYGRMSGGRVNNEMGELGDTAASLVLEVQMDLIFPPGPPTTWDPLYTWLIIGTIGAVVGVGFGYWFWKNKISYRKYM